MKITQKAKTVARKSTESIKHDGIVGFAKRSARFAYYRQFPEKRPKQYRDILVINGCALPHPARYRVDHQIEQLRASGLTVDTLFYDQLSMEKLKYYRGFIFFRCPITDTIREFIAEAKQFNKTCFFDVDDLVIDQKYTDQIEYVQNMPKTDKDLYDNGVNRMRATMELCDYGITTTERLQTELSGYLKEVFINRNVASDEMVSRSLKALSTVKKDPSKVTMGYFSGSITHNEDYQMILPSLIRLLQKYPNLHIKINGILDVPAELQEFKRRVIAIPFMDWRRLPYEVASCDISLAPLVHSIFNDAKSENKWLEAALVKVPTVASDFGAFKVAVKNGKTGVLTDNDKWFEALDDLITDKEKRERLGRAAYKDVIENHTTIHTGHLLAGFIRGKLARNIAFVLPSTDISGGVNVVLKHASILMSHGWDVSLVDAVHRKTLKKSLKEYDYRLSIPGYNVITKCGTRMEAYFDTMVATLWPTVSDIKRYPNVKNRLYFVQSFETDFFPWGSGEPRLLANATYSDMTGVHYVTMSLWCQKWLKDKFGKVAKYASNGIELQHYPVRERTFSQKKIHILIEGDSKSAHKNTDEAFRIVRRLDPDKYDISYLSYHKAPKSWYRVDHFYNRIPSHKVGEIYAKCDILIKTSLVESFSYPPLEMMATGGISVVVPNGGNAEYLRDGENCLLYKQGDIEAGAAQVERLVQDETLREQLIKNGLATAQRYRWENMERDILALYQ